MEFMRVVGSRRSIRWFRPWQPVEPEKIQRILEAARLTGCPGNLQPWRAIVVEPARLDEESRERLLAANNWQRAQVQAPVWIYWYADPDSAVPEVFLDRVREQLPLGAIAAAFGWSESVARQAIEEGAEVPPGLPPLTTLVHGLPYEVSAILAAQETNGACAVAALAAVNEGLGTCLHTVAAPPRQAEVREVLDAPERFVPVWLQLVGYPAESPDAGGQRPRLPFGELFASMRWGVPLARDLTVAGQLEDEGLIQAPAPRPGRFEELEHLGRMFGYPSELNGGEGR
jgi:nitroreductase